MDPKTEHDKIAHVENLIWEISKILQPNSIIDPKLIENAKQSILLIFK